jgi:uncharacterized protein (DUF58 family)
VDAPILIYVILLLSVAIATQDNFVFTLLYLLLGAFLLGRWWSARALSSITFRRTFSKRIFLGEVITLEIEVTNQGRLPAVWVKLQESVPVEIRTSPTFQRVLTLAPHEHVRLSYQLFGRKRGYYNIGPLQLSSGDLLGLSKEKRFEGQSDYIVVYPRVVPIIELNLPSHAPIGTLRYKQPIFEDPNRPTGKRDYTTGDSLRRIDWKASASVGRLQVKQFEPSIELEIAIFLNLNNEEYHYKTRFDATETAITAAASIANWAVAHKQSVGLATNGIDPLCEDKITQPLPPHKGRGHLIRILETLARVKAADTTSINELIRQQRVHLSWGSTLVAITGQADKALFEEFYRAQRAGLDVVLVLCGNVTGLAEIRQQARQFNIPIYPVWFERDLEFWRNQA